ncbi:MAG: hypothetical protein KME64_15260 [Scytonematopsis contorta HA4267-MV1]|jgi:hypothetical protein|nr:hypothetical protein [Scytonematopsis contorta HA4267-MV1]
MKKSTKILIVASLLGVSGFAGLLKVAHRSSSAEPIAIMNQPESNFQIVSKDNQKDKNNLLAKKSYSEADKNIQVKDSFDLYSLNQINQYTENTYDAVKRKDWTQAQANLSQLKKTAKVIAFKFKDTNIFLNKLNHRITKLDKAIKQQNRQSAMRYCNQVTLVTTKMEMHSQLKVPIEITLLDYYGRELEIWSPTGNIVWLHKTAANISLTWSKVRPSILANAGASQADKFDKLIIDMDKASSSNEYSRLANKVQDEVDNLEKIFK